MRSFFSTWRFRIIVGLALLILGLMLRAATTGGFATVTADVVGVVVTPIQRLSATISNAATDFFASFTSYSKVKAENDKLKKQVQQLSSRVVNDDELRRQNEQYKDYLGLKQEHNDYKFEPAMVIARESGQWVSTFTVDKGSLDGIKPEEPVITADGLVGLVTTVMPTSSIVTTILDPSMQVGALISHTGDICKAQGASDLTLKGQLNVVYIPRDSLATQGDIVITSGIGGIYPKGLRIATLQNIQIDKSMSKLAVAQPMEDISTVKTVLIITDFKGKLSTDASSQAGQ